MVQGCLTQTGSIRVLYSYDFIDIDKEKFHIERKRIQVFMAVPSLQEEEKCWKNREGGPLDLLKFIQKYRLENSVPNIVILLRNIFNNCHQCR